MMKRMLCLALMLAMLCTTALGEGHVGRLTFSADAQQITALLEAEGLSRTNGALAQGLAELIGKVSGQLFLQENGLQAGLSLGDTTLLEGTAFVNEEGLFHMLLSVLPSYYLTYPLAAEELARWNAAKGLLQGTAWQAVEAELSTAAVAWWEKLPSQQATGSFMGDAYEGGTLCVTRTLTDEDIATLVDSLAAVLKAHGLADDTMLYSLAQENQAAAEANRYTYITKQVYNGENTLVGLSLAVLDGDSQVMTLSIDPTEEGRMLVLGWGLNDVNYYLLAQWPGEHDQEWAALMYQDSQRLGFRAVASRTEYMLWLAGGTLTREKDGFTLDMELLDPGADVQDIYITLEGRESDAGMTFRAGLHLAQDEETRVEQPVIQACLNWEKAEERTWPVEGRMQLDGASLDNLEDALISLEDELQQVTRTLEVQLFREIPAQLMTFLIFPEAE